ncbi:cell wall-active antibiotics response protein LiaF [Paenibacillus hodogayensis]|uniref:Cell wall-active antibiotics response protein LiaF n=1 Tax=Paenibacillus hodogayensis TaxID=279208 RepID=A0ABV5VR68_9BACL
MRNGLLGKSIGGLILIGIGVVFFLNQLDVITFDLGYVLSHFWPVVLVLIGFKVLFDQRHLRHGHFGSFIGGAVMIGLGAMFLNNNFQWVPEFGIADLIKYAIPAILIVVGLRLLFRPRPKQVTPEPEPYTPKNWQPYSSAEAKLDGMNPLFGEDNAKKRDDYAAGGRESERTAAGSPPPPPPPPIPPVWNGNKEHWHRAKQEWKQHKHEWRDEWKQRKKEWKKEWKEWGGDGGHGNYFGSSHDEYMGSSGEGVDNRSSFVGDVRLGREYWELRPLNISHFVGDTEIDLTRANIPYGETNITISSFVGDVKIYVPNDLQLEISVRASAFLGDMSVFDRWEGGLFRNMMAESPQYHEAEKRVRITVSTFIGDVRVKRVG